MIAVFVNASTPDGFNPYRITRDGIDWEVPDPDDPWSNIGYWGDHQIVYLLRLLEADRPVPARGTLDRMLGRGVVLLRRRSVPHRSLRRDGCATRKATIRYDEDAAKRSAARVEAVGGDGRLLWGRDRRRATSSTLDREAARSGAGQALQLRTRRRHLDEHPATGVERCQQRSRRQRALDGDAVPAAPLPRSTQADDRRLPISIRCRCRPRCPTGSRRSRPCSRPTVPRRKVGPTTPGNAGDRWTSWVGVLRVPIPGVRVGILRGRTSVDRTRITELCEIALEHLDGTIGRNRRDDGLYHAYNLMRFSADGSARRHRAPLRDARRSGERAGFRRAAGRGAGRRDRCALRQRHVPARSAQLHALPGPAPFHRSWTRTSSPTGDVALEPAARLRSSARVIVRSSCRRRRPIPVQRRPSPIGRSRRSARSPRCRRSMAGARCRPTAPFVHGCPRAGLPPPRLHRSLRIDVRLRGDRFDLLAHGGQAARRRAGIGDRSRCDGDAAPETVERLVDGY